MKRSIAYGLALALVLAVAGEVSARQPMPNDRWQDRAGWTITDSLGWKIAGVRSREGNRDTLIGATADTTVPYRIDGAESIVLAVWNTKVAISSLVTYTIRVSPDSVHWKSLATTFTLTQSTTATAKADSASIQILLSRGLPDTMASTFNCTGDRAMLNAATFIQVIASNGYVGGADTTFHSGLLKCRYPPDPK